MICCRCCSAAGTAATSSRGGEGVRNSDRDVSDITSFNSSASLALTGPFPPPPTLRWLWLINSQVCRQPAKHELSVHTHARYPCGPYFHFSLHSIISLVDFHLSVHYLGPSATILVLDRTHTDVRAVARRTSGKVLPRTLAAVEVKLIPAPLCFPGSCVA